MRSRAPGAREPRAFTGADVRRQVMIQGLSMSPDGTSLVYSARSVVGNAYRSRLWRIATDGGRPEPLTAGSTSAHHPRISPDGRDLLFLSDREGGATQAWVLPLGGGEARPVAPNLAEVVAAEWAPDGRRVVLVAPSGEERFAVGDPRDPTARRITDLTWRADGRGIRDQFLAAWVAHVDGRPARRVTPPSFEVVQALWRGDDVLVLADRRPEASLEEIPQLYLVDPATGEPSVLHEPPGGAWIASVDTGDRVAYVGLGPPNSPLWTNWQLFVLAEEGLTPLGGDLDRPTAVTTYGDLVDPEVEVVPPAWDGERIVALVSDRGRCLPVSFGLDGTARRLADGEVLCTAVTVGAGRVAVVANMDGGPADVYELTDGRLSRITRSGGRWFGPFARQAERLTVPGGGNRAVDVWVMRAKGRRPGATVLHVHGGPYNSHGPVPWLEMVALAGAGFNVVWANPTGSTSYGEAFARRLVGHWGEPDGEDLLAVVEWTIAERIADPSRIGIMGLSYGGFMVNRLLGRHPGRFAAAVSENPVTDLVSFAGESDLGWFAGSRGAGLGTPEANDRRYLAASPWREIARNRAPVLFLQSEADLRCPPGQTELVFSIMRRSGVETEMVRYPEEPHYLVGVGRPDRRADRIDRIVAWFSNHL